MQRAVNSIGFNVKIKLLGTAVQVDRVLAVDLKRQIKSILWFFLSNCRSLLGNFGC